MTNIDPIAAQDLLTPEAVRQSCRWLCQLGVAGKLEHFTIDLSRMEACAEFVITVIRENYPDLKVPFHSRWRHFVVNGTDLWQELSKMFEVDARERCRMRFELAITSVLLDAGAGPHWRYTCRNGTVLARSEGLAIASLDAFCGGLFSTDPANPLRADGKALMAVSQKGLGAAFQVTGDNPLEGLEGRVALINNLGQTFQDGRVGEIADRLMAQATNGTLQARNILLEILGSLGSIWPGRIELDGVNLGDTWRHDKLPGNGFVPFHKLSQWLSYSLIEPLQETGIEITEINALTGLAEYRNGGLFVDSGLLQPRDETVLAVAHLIDITLILEWRALTVALLDKLAEIIRRKLEMDERELPLAAILEGGTWAAGRRLAAQIRADGGPPINILSDGSVF